MNQIRFGLIWINPKESNTQRNKKKQKSQEKTKKQKRKTLFYNVLQSSLNMPRSK